MRIATTTLPKSAMTLALTCALAALAACGSDDEPASSANANSPIIGPADDAVNQPNDGTSGGDNTGADGGDTTGTGTDNTGGTGGDTGNGGNDTGDTGDTGAGDTGNGDTGSADAGDGGAGTGDTGGADTGGGATGDDVEDGDVMQPMTGADSTTMDYSCSQLVNGTEQIVTRTLGFDPGTLTFTVDGAPIALGDFVWHSEKKLWVGTTTLAAGSESQYQSAQINTDGVPTFYFKRLSSGEATIEQIHCPVAE